MATYGSAYGQTKGIDPKTVAAVSSLSADNYSFQFQRESYQRVAPDPTLWPTAWAKGVSRAQRKPLSDDELKSIKAPLLVAVGDHDCLAPPLEQVLEAFRLIPGAQLAVVPNAGHFVLNEDPEKLLPIVAAFLDEPTSEVKWATPMTGYHPGVTR